MFSSLKVREFRIYWISMFVSLIGTWIQTMALSWLVFDLTRSAFFMGLVGFLSYLPVSVFSLAAGVYVDRTIKRNLLIATQALFAMTAGLLAFLVYTGRIQIWHVILIAAINGLILSFDAPARHAMIVDVVGRAHLMNAIALNSAAFSSARIIGPAVAGVLIALVGIAGCFLVNALSYVPVLAALLLMRVHPVAAPQSRGSILGDIQESIALIRHKHSLIFLLGLAGLVSTFGVSYLVLMPVFAQVVLHSDAMGLAALMSSSGVGALVGALNIARLKGDQTRLRVLHWSVIAFFLSAMGFSVSSHMFLSCACLAVAGVGAAGSMSIVNAMLQSSIPDGHRGRIMGLFMMMFMGFIPFGSIFFGSLAQFVGVQSVILFGASASLAVYMIAVRKFFSSRDGLAVSVR